MRFEGLLALPGLVAAIPTSHHHQSFDLTDQNSSPLPDDFAETSSSPHTSFSWPSVHETTVQARRILKIHSISTLSTVYPAHDSSDASTFDADRPASVAGAAVGLMDYHASCHDEFAYNPVIIGVTIATTMRNAAAGSNVTLSMRYHLPDHPHPETPPDPWAYLAANLPRFSLVGYIEKLSKEEVARSGVKECFFEEHPDAQLWAPGGTIEPHDAYWAVLRVKEIYFFGGFGDRARIGWLPIEEWQGISEKEVDEYRMIGEKGWEKVQEQYRTHGGKWKNDLELQEDDKVPLELR